MTQALVSPAMIAFLLQEEVVVTEEGKDEDVLLSEGGDLG